MPTALTDAVQKAVLSVTPGKLRTLHQAMPTGWQSCQDYAARKPAQDGASLPCPQTVCAAAAAAVFPAATDMQ